MLQAIGSIMVHLFQAIFSIVIVVGIIQLFRGYKQIRGKEEIEWENLLKVIGLLGLIIIIVLLGGNTNQNPNPFIERIFKPIIINNGMISYAGIILLVAIYYILKRIEYLFPTYLLNSRGKRIIALIIIFNVFMPLQKEIIKAYRTFQQGVDAIYLDRDSMKIHRQTTICEDQVTTILTGEIAVENLSNEMVECGMKINLAGKRWLLEDEAITDGLMLQGLEEGAVWLDVSNGDSEYYKIQPGHRQYLTYEVILEEDANNLKNIDGVSSAGSGRLFEVILYDKESEAYFEGTYFEKKVLMSE